MQPTVETTVLKTVYSAKSFYIFHRVPHITWKGKVTIREWQPTQEVAEIQPSKVRRGENQTHTDITPSLRNNRILYYRILLCFLQFTSNYFRTRSRASLGIGISGFKTNFILH